MSDISTKTDPLQATTIIEYQIDGGPWLPGEIVRYDETDNNLPYLVREQATPQEVASAALPPATWMTFAQVRLPKMTVAAPAAATGYTDNEAVLSARVAELTRQLEESQRNAERLAAKNTDFQTTVRLKAIEVAEQQTWCREGLNEVLGELGLDPANREVTITFDYVIEFSATLTLNTDKDDEELDEDYLGENLSFSDPTWEGSAEATHEDFTGGEVRIVNLRIEE